MLIRVEKPKGAVKRHTRKYARTLGEDRSFFFRGPDGKLNIRAHNLALFLQIGEGVDPETYLFHLRNGDFAEWMRTSIKDEDLADEVANVAANARPRRRRSPQARPHRHRAALHRARKLTRSRLFLTLAAQVLVAGFDCELV